MTHSLVASLPDLRVVLAHFPLEGIGSRTSGSRLIGGRALCILKGHVT